jgi:hypothetical protein
MEWDGFAGRSDSITGGGDADVAFGKLETVTLAATQLASRILVSTTSDPFGRTVGGRQ